MAELELPPIESRILFRSEGQEFGVRDLVDAAHFRGEIAEPWRKFLRSVAENEALLRRTSLFQFLSDEHFEKPGAREKRSTRSIPKRAKGGAARQSTSGGGGTQLNKGGTQLNKGGGNLDKGGGTMLS